MDIQEVQMKRNSRIKVAAPDTSLEGETIRVGMIEETYHKYPEGHPFYSEEGQTRQTVGFVDEGGLPIIVDGFGDTWEDGDETHCYLYFEIDGDSLDPHDLEESGLLDDLVHSGFGPKLVDKIRKVIG